MRLRDVIICSVFTLLAVVLLIAGGRQIDFINAKRQEMRLISNKPLENAPPSLAFATVAMGAFRGLIVDVLWLRAEKLKEEGQFFDAKQLAEWITTLQPRFAAVWEFQAWNMAYNISVALPASQPQERWRWVKNGYELLRDQGIPLNPKSILLYNELARMFQHKIGGVSDQANKYYKLQLALAMEPLLGPANNQYFKALADAPTEWRQIIEDANIAAIISALKAADKTFADEDSFVSSYLSLRQNPGRFRPAAIAVIDRFRGTKALRKFDIFAKAYCLRKTWKLDPVLLQELNKAYGPVDWNDPNNRLPLDWRHPACHAIYWAAKGVQMTSDNEFSMDELNTDRICHQGIQDLFREGKLFIYSASPDASSGSQPSQTEQTKEVFLRPDLRMFESYNKSMLEILDKYKNIERKGSYESLQDGHRNMLRNAVLSFYQAGHRPQAEKIYNQLRQLYPREEFEVPLVVYVKNRLREEFQSLSLYDAQEMVQLMLRESYFRYAMRDDDEAASIEKMAEEVHNIYQTKYSDSERIDLPKLPLIKYFALIDYLNDQEYPVSLRQSLLGRIKVERPDLFEQLKQQQEELQKQSEKTK